MWLHLCVGYSPSKPDSMSEQTSKIQSERTLRSHSQQVCVSNGTEFYEIALSDLDEARADGFYIPEERGSHIVSDGNEIFEIQIADLPEAQADGFRIVGTKINASALSKNHDVTPAAEQTLSASATQTLVHSSTPPLDVSTSVDTDSTEVIHIEETLTEEELEREELLAAYKSATGTDRLWLWWQLYGPTQERIQERISTFGISAIMHVVVLLAMGFIVWTVQREEIPEIVTSISDANSPEPAIDTNIDIEHPSDAEQVSDISEFDPAEVLETEIASTLPMLSDLEVLNPQNPTGSEAQAATSLVGGAQAARGAATAKYGGSPGSEEAVETGLDWLSRHQAEDGSWCFNHTESVKCDCKNAGTHNGKTGATGLALLCYFGAGYTFAEGDHSATVSRGIQYLLQSMDTSSGVYGDLREQGSGNGGIYQHAIATAAICESLSLNLALVQMQHKNSRLKLVDSEGRVLTPTALRSNSQTLRRACERALAYTYYHQSPSTGGWEYNPKKGGDLSVSGWQVQSIASAQQAGIPIPPNVVAGIRKFLLATSKDNGAAFAYKPGQGPKDSMTAVGLMSSILTGADRKAKGIQTGVENLSKKGPDLNNMYYTYYATQVLFGWGDEPGNGKKYWTDWNRRLRDPLVARQSKAGHEQGSWPGASQGGRLMETCLSIMTLEIYYRKLPMLERLSLEPIDLKDIQ